MSQKVFGGRKTKVSRVMSQPISKKNRPAQRVEKKEGTARGGRFNEI